MKPDPDDAPPQLTAPQRNFGLSHDPWGRLVLIDAEGRRKVGVDPVRAFPITHPRNWISICDAEGREVLAIESLDELALGVRQTLENELRLREFIPVIQRIKRLSGDSVPFDWDVWTDRGPTRFTVDNEEDIRRLGPSRVMITDACPAPLSSPGRRGVDRESRRLLERFL